MSSNYSRMGDCEALCDRIGILVRGKLSFIGNLQHLKEDYKDGVTVILRAPKTRQSRTRLTRQAISVKGQGEQIKAEIEDTFPEAILKIEISTYLNYFLPISKIKWSRLFNLLEYLKVKEMITNYSVCETTLEQIFSYNVASLDYLKDQMKIAEFLKERKRVHSLNLNLR